MNAPLKLIRALPVFLVLAVPLAFSSLLWDATGLKRLIYQSTGGLILLAAMFPLGARLGSRAFWTVAVAYLGVCVLSAELSPFPHAAREPLTLLVAGLAVAFATSISCDEDHVRRLIRLVLAAAAAVASLSFAQRWFGLGGLGKGNSSTIGHWNFLGGYMALAIPLAIGLSASARRTGERILLALFCLLAFVCLALSHSRGAWVGAAAAAVTGGACALAIARRGNPRLVRRLVVGLGILVVAAAAIVVAVPSVRERAGSTFDTRHPTAQFRFLAWKGSLEMAADRPGIGWGPGSFFPLFPRYRDPRLVSLPEMTAAMSDPATTLIFNAHNEYLQVLAETGITGAALFLLLVALAVGCGLKGLRERPADQAGVRAGVLAAFASVGAHALFSPAIRFPTIHFHFWLLVGLLLTSHASGVLPGRRPLRRRDLWPLLALPFLCLYVWWLAMPPLAEVHLVRGVQAASPGHLGRAAEELERARRFDPTNPRVHYHLHHVLFSLADRVAEPARRAHLEGSLAALERLRALYPHINRLHFNRALVLERLGRADEALAAIQTEIGYTPGMGENQLLLGRILRLGSRTTAALRVWRAAIGMRSNLTEAYHRSITALLEARKDEAAVRLYLASLRCLPRPGYLAPIDEKPLNRMTPTELRLHLLRRRLAAALSGSTTARAALALWRGDPASALQILERAGGREELPFLLYARWLRSGHRTPLAERRRLAGNVLAAARTATAARPDAPCPPLLAALVLLQTGRRGEAEGFLDIALGRARPRAHAGAYEPSPGPGLDPFTVHGWAELLLGALRGGTRSLDHVQAAARILVKGQAGRAEAQRALSDPFFRRNAVALTAAFNRAVRSIWRAASRG